MQNWLLRKAYREIHAGVQSLRFRTNQTTTKWKQAVQEHKDMLAALERDTVVKLLRDGDISSSSPA